MESYALVDTGADECAFPASFAEILEHNLTFGKQKHIGTGNGFTMAYGHTSRIMMRLNKLLKQNITMFHQAELTTHCGVEIRSPETQV